MLPLFAAQTRGATIIAVAFGPIAAVWFLMLVSIGLWHIAEQPQVLAAFGPQYGVQFLVHHSAIAFVVLGGRCFWPSPGPRRFTRIWVISACAYLFKSGLVSKKLAFLMTAPIFVLERVFLASNLMKVADGAYVPLLIAAFISLMMWA